MSTVAPRETGTSTALPVSDKVDISTALPAGQVETTNAMPGELKFLKF